MTNRVEYFTNGTKLAEMTAELWTGIANTLHKLQELPDIPAIPNGDLELVHPLGRELHDMALSMSIELTQHAALADAIAAVYHRNAQQCAALRDLAIATENRISTR